jgi:hypothetical protein
MHLLLQIYLLKYAVLQFINLFLQKIYSPYFIIDPMLSLAGYNFYIYTSAADMRMGINGLSGIVRNEMALDPLSKGIIYLFLTVESPRRKCYNLMEMVMRCITKFPLKYHSLNLFSTATTEE